MILAIVLAATSQCGPAGACGIGAAYRVERSMYSAAYTLPAPQAYAVPLPPLPIPEPLGNVRIDYTTYGGTVRAVTGAPAYGYAAKSRTVVRERRGLLGQAEGPTVTLLLAQAGFAASIGQWAIIAVVITAVIAVVLVVARANGVNVPPWIVTIAWIVFAAFVGIIAIKLLISFL